jgi:hypothetical protein
LSRRGLLCSFPWLLALVLFVLFGILVPFVLIFTRRIAITVLLQFVLFYKSQSQHPPRPYRGPPSTRFFGPWCAGSDGPAEACSRRFPLRRRFARRLAWCLVAAWRLAAWADLVPFGCSDFGACGAVVTCGFWRGWWVSRATTASTFKKSKSRGPVAFKIASHAERVRQIYILPRRLDPLIIFNSMSLFIYTYLIHRLHPLAYVANATITTNDPHPTHPLSENLKSIQISVTRHAKRK